MALREITEADVESVVAAPAKELPGDDGCFNLWGLGPSKKRIRVTLNSTRNLVVTVANADSRRQQ